MSAVSDPSMDPRVRLGVDADRDPTVEVLHRALRVGRQIEVWLSDVLADEAVDATEFLALAALVFTEADGPVSAGDLATMIVQTSGGTTKTVSRLAARGLLERAGDPADGRRTLIELTPEGRALALSVLAGTLAAFDRDIGALEAAERTELGGLLDRMAGELGERIELR